MQFRFQILDNLRRIAINVTIFRLTLASPIPGMDFIAEVYHINRSVWVTPNYYTDLTPIGTGAFGAVW